MHYTAFALLQIEFITVEDFDRKGKGKSASFVCQAFSNFMEDDVILQLSWSGITKRIAKKSNLKELRAIKDLKGIVILIKGECKLGK